MQGYANNKDDMGEKEKNVMTPTGFEHPPRNVDNLLISVSESAKSGAVPDTDLQRLIDAWPTLPEAMRAGILAIIATASKK